MNQLEALQFVKTATITVQAKINRKRELATSPLENDLFDAAAAINQKGLTKVTTLQDQDKHAKSAFDNLINYVIKVFTRYQLILNFGKLYNIIFRPSKMVQKFFFQPCWNEQFVFK